MGYAWHVLKLIVSVVLVACACPASPAHYADAGAAAPRQIFTAWRRKFGGANRDRTDDLKLAKLALSQLSYGPGQVRSLVGPGRVERPTSRLSGVRSNHLSYEPGSLTRRRAHIGRARDRRKEEEKRRGRLRQPLSSEYRETT